METERLKFMQDIFIDDNLTLTMEKPSSKDSLMERINRIAQDVEYEEIKSLENEKN